jgi:hypothetical protein
MRSDSCGPGISTLKLGGNVKTLLVPLHLIDLGEEGSASL